MWHVTNSFQNWFGIINQLLSLSEVRPRAILPASGEQIVMSPSLKGNNCILLHMVENDIQASFAVLCT